MDSLVFQQQLGEAIATSGVRSWALGRDCISSASASHLLSV